MNKHMKALKFKLDMELHEIQVQQRSLDEAIEKANKTIDSNDKKLNNTHKRPTRIIPEVEISRMGFILQLQQELDDLITQVQDLHQEKARLNTMEIHLKTKLKRLEKLAERKHLQAAQLHHIQENNRLDEWVIQQGVSHEN